MTGLAIPACFSAAAGWHGPALQEDKVLPWLAQPAQPVLRAGLAQLGTVPQESRDGVTPRDACLPGLLDARERLDETSPVRIWMRRLP